VVYEYKPIDNNDKKFKPAFMKAFLGAAILLTVVSVGFSQGLINFNNTSATLGRSALVTNVGTGFGLTGTNFVAQLFLAGCDCDAQSIVIENPSPFRVATTTQPGTWSGGTRTFVASINPGDTVNLVVRVWDSSLYESFGAAFAAGGVIGQSQPFSYLVPINPPTAASLIMNNFQGFIVGGLAPVICPEPSTIFLSILGFGSLLCAKRRKRK
jgi:hypothetical protein